jgi:hypothetical protein
MKAKALKVVQRLMNCALVRCFERWRAQAAEATLPPLQTAQKHQKKHLVSRNFLCPCPALRLQTA